MALLVMVAALVAVPVLPPATRAAAAMADAHGAAAAGAPAETAAHSCQLGRPGFAASFWNPYDDWSRSEVIAEMRAQQAVGDDTIVVDYAVDQEADAAWYPDGLGYRRFESTIPTLVAAARVTGEHLWMGLVVSPTLFAAQSTSAAFLAGEVPRFEAVAADLWRLYGSSIAGWYMPTEPTEADVATAPLSAQYGAWLGTVDRWLHTHAGDRRVMIAAEMPSAVLSGITPRRFIQQLQPMMAMAGIDVWDVEDGFAMTGWSPAEEAQGFAAAEGQAHHDGTTIWADVYTPPDSTPQQWEPYLDAIAAAGVGVLSEWTFAEYMDPDAPAPNPAAAADYAAYRAYCAG
jgi:hypothetical protein